ncbi:MAG: (2Fe-2S)-binding protein [Methylibium sp. NZG]|nr:MAG: (2Fe-2S)-binding protein [Methylibium sp. NZG]
MPERSLWHPVAAQAELGADPLALTLLDQPLVLWQDASGNARAFADRCPHRGTPLSMGRVHNGRLECAYHGWQFGADGRCVHIPAVPAFAPSSTHAACAYEVRGAHGLWWVRLASGADEGPPALAELPPRWVVCGPYDVATSAPRVVENFLDTSHFGFVHEGWLGDRAHTAVPSYEVAAGPGGAPCVPHYRAWQPQANAQAREGAWVDYRYEVLSPYGALLTKHVAGDAGGVPSGTEAGGESGDVTAAQEAYALWVCPVGAEASRVWFTLFTRDGSSSDASLRAFQHTIFTQDQPVLESQRPRRLPLSGGEAHSAADRLSAAYRRYLVAQRITFGVC